MVQTIRLWRWLFSPVTLRLSPRLPRQRAVDKRTDRQPSEEVVGREKDGNPSQVAQAVKVTHTLTTGLCPLTSATPQVKQPHFHSITTEQWAKLFVTGATWPMYDFCEKPLYRVDHEGKTSRSCHKAGGGKWDTQEKEWGRVRHGLKRCVKAPWCVAMAILKHSFPRTRWWKGVARSSNATYV